MLMLGECETCNKLLIQHQSERDEEINKLLLIVSVKRKDGKQAAKYYNKLDEINRMAAEKIIKQLAGGYQGN